MEEVIEAYISCGTLVPPKLRWRSVIIKEYKSIYDSSISNVTGFWEREALRLDWKVPWSSVLEGEPPRFSWFKGGTLSAYQNIVGKHEGRGYGLSLL